MVLSSMSISMTPPPSVTSASKLARPPRIMITTNPPSTHWAVLPSPFPPDLPPLRDFSRRDDLLFLLRTDMAFAVAKGKDTRPLCDTTKSAQFSCLNCAVRWMSVVDVHTHKSWMCAMRRQVCQEDRRYEASLSPLQPTRQSKLTCAPTTCCYRHRTLRHPRRCCTNRWTLPTLHAALPAMANEEASDDEAIQRRSTDGDAASTPTTFSFVVASFVANTTDSEECRQRTNERTVTTNERTNGQQTTSSHQTPFIPQDQYEVLNHCTLCTL